MFEWRCLLQYSVYYDYGKGAATDAEVATMPPLLCALLLASSTVGSFASPGAADGVSGLPTRIVNITPRSTSDRGAADGWKCERDGALRDAAECGR